MKPSRLREIMQRYGDAGVLFVSAYFAGHHLWKKRRRALLLSLVSIFVLGCWTWNGILRSRPLSRRSAGKPMPANSMTLIPGNGAGYRPRKPLLAQATEATTLDKYYCAHLWISMDRLLLVTSTKPTHAYGDMELEEWTGHADMLEWRTKQRQRQEGLTRVFHRMHATPGCFETSPGGHWLKWINYETPDGWPNPAVARLDGSGFQQWQQNKFSPTYWLDDHRWAEEFTHALEDTPAAQCPKELIIHNADQQTTSSLQWNSKPGQKLIRSHYARCEPRFDTEWDRDATPTPNVTISEEAHCSQAEDMPPLHTHTIQMPLGAEVQHVRISPKTHQVLYILRFRQVANIARPRSQQPVLDVWSSQLDGSGLKEIGYVETDGQDYDLDYVQDVGAKTIMSLEWMPDEKHFSFIYHGKLFFALAN